MNKPLPIVLSLYKADGQGIERAEVAYHQTGTDTAECFYKIFSRNDPKKVVSQGKFDSIAEYMDFKPDFRSIWRLKPEYVEQVEAWKQFERDNAKELREYERLKDKFERGGL